VYLEKHDLTGRTAVVTGGGQGIGFASAQALAEANASVIIAEAAADRCHEAAETLRGMGLQVTAEPLDIRDSEAVERLAAKIEERQGGAAILVNNAGVFTGVAAAEDCTDEHWERHMAVNLNGTFYCCRSFGRRMLARGVGAIVNVGSISGAIVNKPQPQSFYNASKAAVHHLTRSLACEWARRGVRVNAVAPTYTETPMMSEALVADPNVPIWREMTPMNRFGQAHEIASVVLFLASDASSLLTGSVILADGGYACW
jgi:NAD(P)-dependent dehydrogenase (short-subunit alcohol dehydrogenase family)